MIIVNRMNKMEDVLQHKCKYNDPTLCENDKCLDIDGKYLHVLSIVMLDDTVIYNLCPKHYKEFVEKMTGALNENQKD